MGIKLPEQFKFPLEANATKAKRTAYFTDSQTLALVDENGNTHHFAYKSELGGGAGGGGWSFFDLDEPTYTGSDLIYQTQHNFYGLEVFLGGLLMREGAGHDYLITDADKFQIIRDDILVDPIADGVNLLIKYRYISS